MWQSGRGMARSIGWNYAGYLYQIAINIGVTSFIARHLAVPEYGLLLFVLSLSSTLYLLDIGISGVLLQAYVAALLDVERARLNDLLWTTFAALSTLGALGALILGGASRLLPGPFNIPAEYLNQAATVVVLSGLIVWCGVPMIALDLIYQAANRFDRLNQAQFLTSTLQLILTVGVLMAGMRIVALTAVQLIVTMIRMVLLIVALPSSVSGARLQIRRFRWSTLQPLLSLSKWAFLNNLSICALELMVWIMLGTLRSMREAALFGLAGKLPTQLWSLIDRGGNVFMPAMSRASAESDLAQLRQTYLNVQGLIFGAVLPFVILGCVFARPLMESWAGNQYSDAGTVLQWLLLAAFAHAVGYPSHQLFYACVKPKLEAMMTLVTVVGSAISCFVLIRFGVSGLAAATALSPLLVNCAWAIPKACRIAGTSFGALTEAAARGLLWPTALLASELAALFLIWHRLTSIRLVSAAILAGCAYLSLWYTRAVLPFYRKRQEIVAR